MKYRLNPFGWAYLPALLLALFGAGMELWAALQMPNRTWWFWIQEAATVLVPFVAIYATGFWEETSARLQQQALKFNLPRQAVVSVFFIGLWWIGFQFGWSKFGVSYRDTMPAMIALTILAVLVTGIWARQQPLLAGEADNDAEDVSAFADNLQSHLQLGQSVVYWETYRPQLLAFLLPVLAVALTYLAVMRYFGSPPLLIFWVAIVFVAMVIAYRSRWIRVSVTREKVVIYDGLFWSNATTLPVAEMVAVDVCIPLHKELLGYTSFGSERQALLSGITLKPRRCVCIETNSEQKILIGSSHPDRLAAAIRAVMITNPALAARPVADPAATATKEEMWAEGVKKKRRTIIIALSLTLVLLVAMTAVLFLIMHAYYRHHPVVTPTYKVQTKTTQYVGVAGQIIWRGKLPAAPSIEVTVADLSMSSGPIELSLAKARQMPDKSFSLPYSFPKLLTVKRNATCVRNSTPPSQAHLDALRKISHDYLLRVEAPAGWLAQPPQIRFTDTIKDANFVLAPVTRQTPPTAATPEVPSQEAQP
jgi:hypothetical protein